MTSVTGIMSLASSFVSFSTDEMDTLVKEFRDYRVAPSDQLPPFTPSEDAAVDYLWASMGELEAITDSECLRFGFLSQLAKSILFFHTLTPIQRGSSAWFERWKRNKGAA